MNYTNESRIVSAVNREMEREHSLVLAAISRAATDYMESLLPMDVDARIDDFSPVAGVVFGHAGKPVAIMDGCDVFPAVRVITLQRVVLAKRAGTHVVDIDASTPKGAALEAALVAMSEFMNRVHGAVSQLRVANSESPEAA
ncbi:hypothetical protein [Aeromonas hydrophila]|uniref:hypothetical protein n=1 Tax=Aeromonas hydrophila TaxID=644 RepID=UPI003D25096D